MAMNQLGVQTGHSESKVLPVILFVLVCSVLAGMIASTGNSVLMIGFVGLFAMAILAFTPRLLFWVVLVSGLVVAGLVRLYLPHLQAIRWLVAGGAIALPFVLAFHAMFSSRKNVARGLPPFLLWAVAFVAFSAMSGTALSRGWSGAMLGFKDYFQAWGLLAAFLLMPIRPTFRKALLTFSIALGMIQVPLALHQYFFLVPLRIGVLGVMPADIVAGTFGGDMNGGGNNAAMAAYQFFCISIVLCLWKYGQLGVGRMLTLVGFLAVPVLLNETKVSFIFAMLVFCVIFWEEIKKNPLRFAQASIFLAVILSGFVMSYVLMAEKADRINGLAQYLDLLVEHNLYRGYGTYQLNRFTALSFWFTEHVPRDLLHALVGHGLAQTREASAFVDIGTTLAAKRYAGMGIGVTALSGLLWEVGLIGVGLVIAMFVSAFRLAGRLSRSCREEPVRQAFLKGAQAGIAVAMLSLAHKSLFMFELTYQIFVVLLLGYLAYEYRLYRVSEYSRPTVEG